MDERAEGTTEGKVGGRSEKGTKLEILTEQDEEEAK